MYYYYRCYTSRGTIDLSKGTTTLAAPPPRFPWAALRIIHTGIHNRYRLHRFGLEAWRDGTRIVYVRDLGSGLRTTKRQREKDGGR